MTKPFRLVRMAARWLLLAGLLTAILAWTRPSPEALGADPKAKPAPAEFVVPQEPSHWDAVGWGGGGFFWCCAHDPDDSNVIYLGGDVCGVYKTEDQGRHWRFINRGLVNYAVHSMAVAPKDRRTLYVLTKGGICKTHDGGEHWEFVEASARKQLNITASRPHSVRGLAIAPDNPDLVYAGGESGKLYRTADGGKTWREIPYQKSAGSLMKSVAAQVPAYSGKGFLILTYQSDAGSATQSGRVGLSFPAPGADWTAYQKVTAQFYVPPDAPPLEAQLVLQSGEKWLWQQGPFVVGKPGAWTEVSLDLAVLKDLRAVQLLHFVVRSPRQGYHGEVFLDAVALHAERDSHVAPGEPAAQPGIVGLSDWEKPGNTGGWQPNRKFKDFLFVTDVRQSADTEPKEQGVVSSVVIAPNDTNLVFVCNSRAGLFRSADGGECWTRLQTPLGASSVAVAPSDPKRLYAALGKDGVYRSADKGATWTAVNTGLVPQCLMREVAIDPADPDRVYAIGSVDWNGYFFRSEDGGRQWTSVRAFTRDLSGNPTLPDENGGGAGQLSRPTNLAMHPLRPQQIFLSCNWSNVLSDDGGKTWVERIRGADITCVQDIQFCAGKTYVAAMDEGLLVSEDNGAAWRQLIPRKYTPGVSGHQWRVHVWDVGGAQRILTTVSPWPGNQEYPNAVLTSDDGGRTFAKNTQGLPDYVPRVNCMWGQGYARALAADPRDPQVIYLGMDGDPEPAKNRAGGGLFRSADGGRTWQQLPHQPPSRRVFFGLAVDPTDPRRLYWAASGLHGGLYRSDDGGETWQAALKAEGWIFNMVVSDRGVAYCGGKNLYRSEDHGRTWKAVSRFTYSDNRVIVGIELDPQDPKRVWISRVAWSDDAVGGVYRTTDGGATWREITGTFLSASRWSCATIPPLRISGPAAWDCISPDSSPESGGAARQCDAGESFPSLRPSRRFPKTRRGKRGQEPFACRPLKGCFAQKAPDPFSRPFSRLEGFAGTLRLLASQPRKVEIRPTLRRATKPSQGGSSVSEKL